MNGHAAQAGKGTGYRPTLKPLEHSFPYDTEIVTLYSISKKGYSIIAVNEQECIKRQIERYHDLSLLFKLNIRME